MPGGGSPAGRIYAGPFTKRVVDARGSKQVLIQNVRIVGGDVGVDGGFSNTVGAAAVDLHIYNSELNYSDFAAIYATNTIRLNMVNSKVIGALHSGVYARNASTGAVFTGNDFQYVGNVGMHKGGVAAIYVNNDSGPLVSNNTFKQIGKTAIWTGVSTYGVVSGNTINGACIIHGDCGGIYLFSRANPGTTTHKALTVRIHHNVVQGVTGAVGMRIGGDPNNLERYAIYLDDYANGVDVYDNQILNNATGIQVHHGSNNRIMGNIFNGNTQRHILFANNSSDSDASGLGSNNYVGTGANVSGFQSVAGGNTFYGPVQAFQVLTPTLSSATSTATFTGNTYLNYSGVSIGSPSLNYK
jgi:parallel beta-helix repeat protein